MSLQSLKIPAALLTKLNRKIRELIKEGILHPSDEIDPSWTIGFCMHIQVVPKKKIDSLAFGKPEGIRAFIQCENKVIAAADFMFKKNRMKLSYLHYGQGLALLLAALNKLEKKYKGDKEPIHAELIYFLLGKGPYLLIKSKTKRQFYYSTTEKIRALSEAQLKKHLGIELDHSDQTV